MWIECDESFAHQYTVPTLPPLPTLQQVKTRLESIFPSTFPDRGILVGDLAAKMVFVALYGGSIEGSGQLFRPSTVMRFSDEQAALTSMKDRSEWLKVCHSQGYKPQNPWYADNSRETLRDDLIRNRAIPIGVVKRIDGLPPTSPNPIYFLPASFAALFDPALQGAQLDAAIQQWRSQNLNAMTLKRMALLAAGVKARSGQITVTLPTTGKTLRLAPGEASAITRDVCEVLSTKLMASPVVVHVSLSDQKKFKELEGEAASIGLAIDTSAELPDVVIADVGGSHGMTLAFVEVVHTDGPVTELRKLALLKISSAAGIAAEHVLMITAFADRNSPAFKKRFSELAKDSLVWFCSEPDLIVELNTLREPD